MDIHEFLEDVSNTGEIITVAYAGGSRPGEPRKVTITTIDPDKIRCIEVGQTQSKQYRVDRIIWAEDSSGIRVESEIKSHIQVLPNFDTLKEYADFLMSELEKSGWYIHQEDDLFGVGEFFKNGKPKKTPKISIRYNDPSLDIEYDFETGDFVEVKKELTGRERPWRIDSPNFTEGKTYGKLHSAMKIFIEEVNKIDI